MRLILIYFLFFLFISDVCAQECPEIDLTKGSQMIPYWDQGDTRFCYGYAASYLANFYYNSRGEEVFVNPLSVSTQAIITTLGQSLPSNIWGGHLSHGLSAIEQGVCTTTSHDLELGGWTASNIYNAFFAAFLKNKKGNLEQMHSEILQIFSQTGSPDFNSPTETELAQLSSKNSTEFISNMLNRLCERKELPLLPEEIVVPKTQMGLKLPSPESLLEEQLFKMNPVAIHFCSDVILDPSFTFTSFNQICSEHYAVIVGQRLNEKNQCEVKLQDSQCEHYNSNNQGICQEGTLWIERSVILKTLKNFHWLDI